MGEPLLIIGIFVSLSMLLPLAFPCTPTNCYIKQGDSKPYCPEGTSSNIRWVTVLQQYSSTTRLSSHLG